MTNCFHYANSQEAEARYRDLWENAPAFFISILKGGVIFEINRTAAHALGYPLHDLIGQPLRKVIDPDEEQLFESNHRKLMETGNPNNYELTLVKKTGESIAVSFRSEPLLNRDGMIIGEKGVLYDITRDKQLEAQLRDYSENLAKKVQERTIELTQATNFLNAILEGSTEYGIMGLDADGKFLHFNSGAQLIYGYDAAAMLAGQTFEHLVDFDNAPWTSLESLLRRVDRHGVEVKETPMITADGHTLNALVTINRLSSPAANLTYVVVVRDITEQKELEELLRLYTENLQQVVEQKTRELDRKHIQLIQSSKLATLGEMATGIAHEMNQPLSGIRTRAQLITKALERNIVDPERIMRTEHEIIQLVDRITRIIHHMRIFARQDQQRFAAFQVTQSIDGAMSLMGEQLRIHAIHVTKEIAPDLPLIYGEPLQIEQVILNLLGNARDAMDARGEQLREENDGEPVSYHKQLVLRVHPSDRGGLAIEIEDNGTGMSDSVRSKIFEPFYTTKPVGRGTGLGLSICYGILTNHGGSLEVESQSERGTIFRVLLPIHTGDVEELDVPDPDFRETVS